MKTGSVMLNKIEQFDWMTTRDKQMNFGGGLKAKPKGDNKVSSSELLNILRHPAPADVNDGVNSRHSSGKDSIDGSCLEGEFSKLFLNNYEVPNLKPTSASDNYGMTGLADQVMTLSMTSKNFSLSYGLDTRATGLRLDQGDQTLSKSFISPWIDRKKNDGKSASNGDLHGFGLESVLPACYNVQASPPVTSKISSFTDETLFYMFYAMPGDKMQDLAARELTGRNWRFHKELKVWIMLEDPSASNVQKAMISPDLSGALPKASGSVGGGKASTPISNLSQSKGNNTYAVFDPQTWTKISKELPIKAEHLEDRFLTISDTKLILLSLFGDDFSSLCTWGVPAGRGPEWSVMIGSLASPLPSVGLNEVIRTWSQESGKPVQLWTHLGPRYRRGNLIAADEGANVVVNILVNEDDDGAVTLAMLNKKPGIIEASYLKSIDIKTSHRDTYIGLGVSDLFSYVSCAGYLSLDARQLKSTSLNHGLVSESVNTGATEFRGDLLARSEAERVWSQISKDLEVSIKALPIVTDFAEHFSFMMPAPEVDAVTEQMIWDIIEGDRCPFDQRNNLCDHG